MPTSSKNTDANASTGRVADAEVLQGSNRPSTAGLENLPPVKSSTSASESVVRSAGVVSIAVFMSRITGLLRESVMARLFGAGLIYDAFMLGFRIPNLTRDLFAEGALSSAFVPTFTEYLSLRGKEEAARLVNLVATALIIVVGTLCALGMVLRRSWFICWLLVTRPFRVSSSSR